MSFVERFNIRSVCAVIWRLSEISLLTQHAVGAPVEGDQGGGQPS